MEPGERVDLDSSRIAALSKRETHRAVLEYVKQLRSFSKVHAAEGKAHMASWDDKEASLDRVSSETRSQSCGFATPVLKPRIPPARRETSTNTGLRAGNLSKSRSSIPAGAKTTAKSNGNAISKEPPARRENRSAKRNRDLQSDEEKRQRRLAERREKKRSRREIMRPEASKKNDDRLDDNPRQKSKKSKQKAPAGLALMYGFTATNVGKNRLTIDPPFRSGVFGKGRASAQTRVRESRSKGKNSAFSEEQFLKSAGNRRHSSVQSSTSVFDLSSTSSKHTDDEDPPRHKRKERTQALSTPPPSRTGSEVALARKRRKKEGAPREAESKKRPRQGGSYQPSKKAQSVIWDIEKESGVLPTDDSSILSRGPKPSTILLNVARKGWLPDPPQCESAVTQEPPEQQKASADNDTTQRLVSSDEQNSPSLISSVRPSESPSQVALVPETKPEIPAATVSKYFTPIQLPQANAIPESPSREKSDPHVPSTALRRIDSDSQKADLPTTREETKQDLVDAERGDLQELGYLDFAEGLIPGLNNGTTGSDWLLSDPISREVLSEPECDMPDSFFLERPSNDLIGNQEVAPIESNPGEEDGPYEHLEFDAEGTDCLDLVGREVFQVGGDFGIPQEYDLQVSQELDFLDACESELALPELEFYEPTHTQTSFAPEFTGNSSSDRDIGELNETYSLVSDETSPLSTTSSEVSQPEVTNSFRVSKDEGLFLHFNEGRCLLLSSGMGRNDRQTTTLEIIEADVAQHLVGHWVPQKY
ncbi:hypothetical protein AN958_00838 [Leucoagaricus sp. SymC.cos]|nr:hypothetical protein AN958_00838 [Leucoagaricus sp. SymC.cos]